MASSSNLQLFVHGTKLVRKAANDASLKPAVEAYERWKHRNLETTTRTKEAVAELTAGLNDYKSSVEPLFDSRPNSAQEILQSSIIEEFFEYLFSTIEVELKCGPLLRKPAAGYLELSFNPKSIKNLIQRPEYTIRRKDHDFVIGAAVTLSVRTESGGEAAEENVVIPAVALECKRYLERNMLDECSGTAEKIKHSTPYCLYLVVAEYLKMDDCSPELSRIDEIYILRKQKNSERLEKNFVPKPIDPELVWDIYEKCLKHLSRVWWDPNAAVASGKVFNFPG